MMTHTFLYSIFFQIKFDTNSFLHSDIVNNDLYKKLNYSSCITKSYDPVGFKKLKMPPGLHERLISYYQYHYPKRARALESWSDTNTQLNFMSVKSYKCN